MLERNTNECPMSETSESCEAGCTVLTVAYILVQRLVADGGSFGASGSLAGGQAAD